MLDSFISFRQTDKKDCGPTCLRIICRYYDKIISIEYLRELTNVSHFGTTLYGLSTAAEKLGFRTITSKMTFKNFVKNFSLPTIVHWKQNHFIVVYKVKRNYIYVADPAIGKMKYDYKSFLEGWSSYENEEAVGVALYLEPTPQIYAEDDSPKISFSYFLSYFSNYKKQYLQVILGMLASMVIGFLVPFTTKSVIDIGINGKNINFINLMLIAQFVLAFSTIAIGFIQSWLFMHIATKIGLSITIGYIAKVMKLKIPYIERKTLGDFMQRMSDNGRIQAFISTSTISTVFSFTNVIIFGVVMATYNLKVLAVFLIGSSIYALWILLFIKKRREFDMKKFEQNSESQTSIVQIFNGIRDIKLFNFEKYKRWEWERIQAKIFKLSMRQLSLSQVQQTGAFVIEQSKNIIITYIIVTSVINGEISFGTMIAMQYILAQMGSPLQQLISLINSYQDAKVSLDRIAEIHNQEDEETLEDELNRINNPIEITSRTIQFQEVTFSYNKLILEPILNNINLTFPEGKFTAVVGASGCGKTTLIKLLLRFYSVDRGSISIGDLDLNNISINMWRNQCGAVLQDGYLFSGTIGENVALSSEGFDQASVISACKSTNIHDFIKTLPLGYKTKIGENGMDLSQGQKQRLLIARILYKKPDFVFFDEATNALDAENEKIVMKSLRTELVNKTIIFVSHRLSAISNADNIIVMDKGKVVEQGNHIHLMNSGGLYFNMFNSQQNS